jgi:hypothetical protein
MKKLLFLLLFILYSVVNQAAARFWVGGGSSHNWNATTPTNWGSSSGTADNASVPGSGSYAIFDGAGAHGSDNFIISASVTIDSLLIYSGFTGSKTINASQKITVQGNLTDNPASSWTVNSTDAGALTISAASHINSGGLTFPGNVTFSGSNTKILYANWVISGKLTCSTATTTINNLVAETLSCVGLAINNNTSGSATILCAGGTWSSNSPTNVLTNNLTLSGTIDATSANLGYNTGTLTNNGATVNAAGGTLYINGSCTLNTSGISWNNITILANSTLTLNSLLTAIGTFTVNSSFQIIFAGTSGFSIATYTDLNTVAKSQTFANGVTYTITTALNAFNSRTAAILLFTSNHATNKAILTLQNGATCNVLANFTRIDASAGRTIFTFNGTATSCLNVVPFNDLRTVSKSFVQ